MAQTKRPVGLRTKNSLAELTQSLKAAYRAQRVEKEQAALARDMARNPIPKAGAKKLSHGTKNAYGANTFRTCPGGTRDEARTGAFRAMLKQIEHPETGCIVADTPTLARLQHSARNANTTSTRR